MEVYIIGAGEFSGFAKRPTAADHIIAADGGFAVCQREGIVPDLVLGDFDSLGYVPNRGNVRAVAVDKDDTDMMLAVRHGLSLGAKCFHLYGGTGGRLDHTVANLQTLLYLTECGAKGYLYDKSGMFTVILRGTETFQAQEDGVLSVFAIGGDAKGVTITGGKYALQDGVLQASMPLGVSNHFVGKPITVTVRQGAVLVGLCRE